MTSLEAICELMEMRRRVVRERPHVDCWTDVKSGVKCTCYKLSLRSALLRAEMQLRTDLGMPPF